MAQAVNNLVQASKHLINAASSTINVGCQVINDGSKLINSGVQDTPAVCKALFESPCAAAKGYIMEAEGVSAEEAEARAYKYVRQELSRTITEAGEGSGKLLAALLKDDLVEGDVSVEDLAKQHTKAELAKMLKDARS